MRRTTPLEDRAQIGGADVFARVTEFFGHLQPRQIAEDRGLNPTQQRRFRGPDLAARAAPPRNLAALAAEQARDIAIR